MKNTDIKSDAPTIRVTSVQSKHLLVALCIIGATIVAAMDISGWGWFLFAAVIINGV